MQRLSQQEIDNLNRWIRSGIKFVILKVFKKKPSKQKSRIRQLHREFYQTYKEFGSVYFHFSFLNS